MLTLEVPDYSHNCMKAIILTVQTPQPKLSKNIGCNPSINYDSSTQCLSGPIVSGAEMSATRYVRKKKKKKDLSAARYVTKNAKNKMSTTRYVRKNKCTPQYVSAKKSQKEMPPQDMFTKTNIHHKI